MLFLKIAILLDWIYIFAPSHGLRGKFYYTCVANIILSLLFYIPLILIEIFACTPRSKIWNSSIDGKCVDIYVVNVASSVFNFVLDLMMLAMPLSVIWKLQLSRRKKVALSMLFTVGIL